MPVASGRTATSARSGMRDVASTTRTRSTADQPGTSVEPGFLDPRRVPRRVVKPYPGRPDHHDLDVVVKCPRARELQVVRAAERLPRSALGDLSDALELNRDAGVPSHYDCYGGILAQVVDFAGIPFGVEDQCAVVERRHADEGSLGSLRSIDGCDDSQAAAADEASHRCGVSKVDDGHR